MSNAYEFLFFYVKMFYFFVLQYWGLKLGITWYKAVVLLLFYIYDHFLIKRESVSDSFWRERVEGSWEQPRLFKSYSWVICAGWGRVGWFALYLLILGGGPCSARGKLGSAACKFSALTMSSDTTMFFIISIKITCFLLLLIKVSRIYSCWMAKWLY